MSHTLRAEILPRQTVLGVFDFVAGSVVRLLYERVLGDVALILLGIQVWREYWRWLWQLHLRKRQGLLHRSGTCGPRTKQPGFQRGPRASSSRTGLFSLFWPNLEIEGEIPEIQQEYMYYFN